MIKKLKKRENKEQLIAYLSLLPLLLVLILIRGYPIVTSIEKSFTNWNGLFRSDFVGFSNYIVIFTSRDFLHMFRNNFILLLHIPLKVGFAFIFALLLYEKVFGWKTFRNLFFLPSIISPVVVGAVFRAFFGFKGPINILLNAIGLEALAVDWLGRGDTAMFVLMVAIIWSGLGWNMLIISGGLASMDPSVLEASRIDGAGYWRRLINVVIPMQVRAIEYSFVVSIVWVFSGMFAFILTITGGGPGFSTTTLDYMVYLQAFVTGNRMGLASANAVILLLVTLILVKIQLSATDKLSEWE